MDNLNSGISNQAVSNLDFVPNEAAAILLLENHLAINQPLQVENVLNTPVLPIQNSVSLEKSLIHQLLSGDNIKTPNQNNNQE
jgi:hypothetical protein